MYIVGTKFQRLFVTCKDIGKTNSGNERQKIVTCKDLEKINSANERQEILQHLFKDNEAREDWINT